MVPTPQRRWIAALLVCLCSLPIAAQDWKANPRELVKRAIQNEEKESAQKTYFLFRDTNRKKDGRVETKEMIQTPQLVLARLVAINGQPLSDEQRSKEEARLNRLTASNDELQKKIKEQHEDDMRARKMVAAIPDAFNFEYVGTEEGKSGQVVVLKFSPNTSWEAPNRELQVFEGMSGTLKIDVKSERLAQMQAQLFKDVEFGWGILGRLYKGGDFLIEQSEIAPGHWETTHMKLHFTGKILFVKSLNIQEDESSSDYRPVQQMNVAEALNKLKQVESEYAKGVAAGN